MKCRVCGALMRAAVTDLPFKLSDRSIVVIKGLPVLLCENCTEYMLEDRVMATVDQILDGADDVSELRVVKYAA
ncbi:MAG: YgiT-type zinc finger protein [Nitrospira sp.]|nr:YgiT-type zinc finger protein [Nitrospira sp.]